MLSRRFLNPGRRTYPAFALAAVSLCTTAGAQPKDLPVPKITFQGENVTFNKHPQRVAIGQKITLDADQSGQTQQWTISTTGVYRRVHLYDEPPNCPYFPDTPQNCVVYDSPVFTQPETTFYFLDPGTYEIDYTYTKANGQSAQSSTTFEADGPDSVAVKIKTGSVQILPSAGCFSSCTLALANLKIVGGYGIELTASGNDPKGIPGQFLWSQQVRTQTTFTKNQINYVCPVENGLDNTFPASENNRFGDEPNIPLSSDRTYLYHFFSARTELLWQAKKSDYVLDSTPVDLGNVAWSWDGVAEFYQGSGWELSNSNMWGATYTAYPEPLPVQPWQDVLLNSYDPDCVPQP